MTEALAGTTQRGRDTAQDEALAGALLALARGRWVAVGALCGLAILSRPGLAVVPAVLGLGMALSLRSWRPVWQVGVPSAAGLGLLFVYNSLVFGAQSSDPPSFGRGTPVPDVGTRFVTNAAGTLLSPERGVLVLYPFLIAVVPALVIAWRSAEPWMRVAALGGLAAMVVQLSMNDFSGGGVFFGSRLTLEWLTLSLPIIALASVEAVERRRLRMVWITGAWIAVTMHVFGAVMPVPPMTNHEPWNHHPLLWYLGWQPATSLALFAATTGLTALVYRRLKPVLEGASVRADGAVVHAPEQAPA